MLATFILVFIKLWVCRWTCVSQKSSCIIKEPATMFSNTRAVSWEFLFNAVLFQCGVLSSFLKKKNTLCLLCLGFSLHRDLWLIHIFLNKHLSHAKFMCRTLVTVEDVFSTLTSTPRHVKIESGYDKAQNKTLNRHLYIGVCVCIYMDIIYVVFFTSSWYK